jgi:hypothetical protein
MVSRRGLLLTGLVEGLRRIVPPLGRLETMSDWLRANRKTRQSEVQSCLERIQTTDTSIQAWVQVLPQKPTGNGKLSGIPFGAKDVIETRGLATEYGSPIYRGRIGRADAAIIKDLRSRAILLGKTHATAVAYRDPPPTRNPRNLEHTPGGSSSGSAAAVAAGMVPFALGTQTQAQRCAPLPTVGLQDRLWMAQIARNITDDMEGFFKGKRYLIHDRDPLYTQEFLSPLADAGIESVKLPPRSSNLNAYAERFVRSIKEECLEQMILFGEDALRNSIREFLDHFHRERNHQGLGNRLIIPINATVNSKGRIERRERLGGLMNYYYRAA